MKLNLLSTALLAATGLCGLSAHASVLDSQCKVTGLEDKAGEDGGRTRHPIEDWLEQSKDPTSTHPLTRMTIDELLDELITCQDALLPARKQHTLPAMGKAATTLDI